MSNKQQKQKYVRVLAWVLSIAMVGSLATTIITLIMYFLGA